MVLLLSKKDIQQLLTMNETINCVEEAYKQIALGNAFIPQRISISDPAPGITLIMPGLIGGEMNALATKVVSVYEHNNKKYNLPTVLAKILVQNIETGEVVGIMDGSLITSMRTGAATGVSVKFLARKNSLTMGIFGAGIQARKQVLAVYWALNKTLEVCKVYDPNPIICNNFKKELEDEMDITVEIVSAPTDVIKNIDILVCATISPTPVFNGAEIAEGVHISSIGSHTPQTRELDSKIIERASLLVAGHKEACLSEAGDFIIPIQEGKISQKDIVPIGDIILGNRNGRQFETDITVFKSVGVSAQDVAVAKLVYDKAIEKGIGIETDF